LIRATFIVNDPYLGGTHLMDIRFVKPFFYWAAVRLAATPATGRVSAAWCRRWPAPPGRAGGPAPAADKILQEG
jgi:N-methylhydantoinase B